MPRTFEIIESSRNKIVLSQIKNQFIHIEYMNRYSKTNAFNLGILAKAAYLKQVEIENFLFINNKRDDRDHSFTNSPNFRSCFLTDCTQPSSIKANKFYFMDMKSTNTQLFHFETDKYVLISFRGTFENADWLTNGRATLVPFKEGAGKIHEGFYSAFNSVKARIDIAVDTDPNKPVILCGHSLGGALATVASAYIKNMHRRNVMVYTFGSPLVGDSDFVHHFTKVEPIIAYRVVHNRDLVTMIPPPHSNLRVKLLFLALTNPVWLIPATYDPNGKPFTHIGKLVFIRRIEKDYFSVDVDRKMPAYIRIPSRVLVNEERPTWDAILNWAKVSVHEHFMENYLSIIGSDLKHAVVSYLQASSINLENAKRILAYLEAEVKAIQARRDLMERDLLSQPAGPPASDATSAGVAPSGRMTPLEKMHLIDEALGNKQMELSLQRTALAAISAPSYAKTILKDIIDLPMASSLRRELEYQASKILY